MRARALLDPQKVAANLLVDAVRDWHLSLRSVATTKVSAKLLADAIRDWHQPCNFDVFPARGTFFIDAGRSLARRDRPQMPSETGASAVMCLLRPGRAWADAIFFSASRPSLSSLQVFGNHFPFSSFVLFVMPGVWSASRRSCNLLMLASSFDPMFQTVLAEPGPSGKVKALSVRRCFIAAVAASFRDALRCRLIAAATNSRSFSAATRVARGGPSIVARSPDCVN